MNANAPIIAGILGGVVFATLLLLFGSVLWAGIAGIAAFGAGMLIAKPRPKETHTFEMYGLDKGEVAETLRQGRAKVAHIQSAAAQVADREVRGKIEDLIDVAGRIFTDIEEDPKDIRRARQFFSYYLDATINIVDRYVSLGRRGVHSAEIKRSLEKTESILDTLRKAFEKQLSILLEDDVMDLDSELQLLERTIKMEGLGEDER